VGTLRIADPQNWVALSIFLAVSVVASNLSTAVRDRASEATARGDELARLFDLSRDILLTTDSREAMAQLARFVSRRFDLEYTLRNHPLDIVTDSDSLVRVDPRLTASALAHLLENAAQYSPPGSPITVEIAVSGQGLSVRVRDRGPGVDAADLPRLFERFYRGREAKRRASGTGMGLAIARGMLSAEGGQVWAENRPDGGAEFTIAVPAETRPATPGDEET
jgi:K+-sensing histidine kinase KdpD